MGRLEKARAEKYKGEKNFLRLFLVILVILIVAALFIIALQDRLTGIFSQQEINLIDRDRSAVFIDMFELTYVWIYLNEGVVAESVKANDELLEYNSDKDRWELVTIGYEADAEIVVNVKESGEGNTVQKLLLIVQEL